MGKLEKQRRNRIAQAKCRAKNRDARLEKERSQRALNIARPPDANAPYGYRADGSPRRRRRLGLNWKDPSVLKNYHRERGHANYPKKKAKMAAQRAADPEAVRAAARKNRAPPHQRAAQAEQNRKWNLKNPGRAAANSREWRKKNPDWHRANANQCRANRVRATPPWADFAAIRAVYAEALKLTEETGIKHEVDHIIPIKHPTVCGLNVSYNLRAVPWTENRKKRNRFYSTDAFAFVDGLLPIKYYSDAELLAFIRRAAL